MSARAFPATLAAVEEAESWAEAECPALALDAFAVTLCLEELFVNAVNHGGAARVRIALRPGGLEFCDDGAAFDPTRPTPKTLDGPSLDFQIGGFGLGLVKKFARHVNYARAGEWNVVTLAFAEGAR